MALDEVTDRLQRVARALDEARIERLPRMAALRQDLTRLIGRLAATDWSFLR